jgi:hypothetical protein
MHYKTIVLEMLQEQYPTLHEQLRASRTLLLTLDILASQLKAGHEAWTQRYCEVNPGKDRRQMAADALEPAIQDLRDRLPSEPDGTTAEYLTLDGAMSSILGHTPHA